MNNLFLMLCQQAERNQSYDLAKYLTWRSHQRETGYRATLFDDYYEGLQLIVTSVDNPDDEKWFDLSKIGQETREEEERQREEETYQEELEEMEENTRRWFEGERTVEKALSILCMKYSDLWDYYGEDYKDVLDDAWDIAMDAQTGEWDDSDPQYPNNPCLSGRIVNGQKYGTHYSGVAGNYWDSEWLWCGPEHYDLGDWHHQQLRSERKNRR